MDRRTLIAFGLIFLLFIGYFAYMSRFSNQSVPSPGRADSTFAQRPSAAPVETPRGDTPDRLSRRDRDRDRDSEEESIVVDALLGSGGPGREIVVMTDLARYTFDSRGAVLTEVELTEFRGLDSEYPYLLGGEAVLDVIFETPAGFMDSGEWTFTVDLPAGQNFVELRNGEALLTFHATDGAGAELTKIFGFQAGRYEISLDLRAELGGALAGTDAVNLDWHHGILGTEKNRKDELRSFNSFFQVGEKQTKKSLRNFSDNGGLVSRGVWSEEGTLQWVATRSKYFVAALIPGTLMSGYAALTGDKEDEYLGWRANYPLRGGRNRFAEKFDIYVGPLDYNHLKVYGRGLEDLVDMGKLLRPISLALKWLMDFLSRYIPNYGVIIILMSIVTKLLFYRLTHKGFKSMKAMQAVQPELKKIQEKYKNNKEQLNKAMMELYKEHGVNPLGGCLPMLLQMPVFFALYKVLRGAVELRGAGFVGWIDDLSNMDILYALPFQIPFLGTFIENSISVLPILMGLSMWAQQKWGGSGMGMSPGGSPQAGQMAAMNKIMPIFMTFIFYRMPSGLVLYWLVNNILTAVQQYYIHRGQDDSATVVPANP